MHYTFARALPLVAFLMAAVPAAHAVEQLPMSIPGGTFVTEAQAKELYDKGTLFVDARVAAEYADEHVKSAINVVYKETFPKESKTSPSDSFDLTKLPAAKDKPLLFYCNGSPCWKAYKGASAAIKAGHKNVYWMREGMPGWKAKGYPTE